MGVDQSKAMQRSGASPFNRGTAFMMAETQSELCDLCDLNAQQCG
jgi:hypothetical protein